MASRLNAADWVLFIFYFFYQSYFSGTTNFRYISLINLACGLWTIWYYFHIRKQISKSPQRAYYRALNAKGRYRFLESVIAQDAEYSYQYALNKLHGRFEKGELIIAAYPETAYRYARDVIEGAFPLGEEVIANIPSYSLSYAAEVLRGRFVLGEPTLATSAYYAYHYAVNVCNARFPLALGEETILNDSLMCDSYMNMFFPKSETKLDWKNGF